jgi:hypothetical protein
VANEVVSVSWTPNPVATLHESDESDVQLDSTQGVPASATLGDADDKPKIPFKTTQEPPVEAKKLEVAGLQKEKAEGLAPEIFENDALAFKLRTESTNEALPIS